MFKSIKDFYLKNKLFLNIILLVVFYNLPYFLKPLHKLNYKVLTAESSEILTKNLILLETEINECRSTITQLAENEKPVSFDSLSLSMKVCEKEITSVKTNYIIFGYLTDYKYPSNKFNSLEKNIWNNQASLKINDIKNILFCEKNNNSDCENSLDTLHKELKYQFYRP